MVRLAVSEDEEGYEPLYDAEISVNNEEDLGGLGIELAVRPFQTPG